VKLRKWIEDAVCFRPAVGEEGAPTAPEEVASVEGDAPPAEPDMSGKPDGMPEDIYRAMLQDPDYVEARKKPAEEISPPDPMAEGETTEDEDFEDDVIPGLKGEALKALTPEAREALAEFYTQAEESKKQVEQYKAREKLLEDPVVKQRIAQLQGNGQEFVARNITEAEAKKLAEKHGLTPEEIMAIAPDIEAIAKDMAENMARQTVAQEVATQRRNEVYDKGRQMLLSLSEFNPELKTDITPAEIVPLLEQKEQHPKWEQWQKGPGKIYEWAMRKEFTYQDLVKLFSPKSLYAAAAADLDLPVALNTRDRDAKLRKDAVSAKLRPFLKTERAGTLDARGGDTAASKRAEATVTVNGYDAVKLATDERYYESQLQKAFGNPQEMARLTEAAAKGRNVVKRGKKS
jgi:hypothetical protein